MPKDDTYLSSLTGGAQRLISLVEEKQALTPKVPSGVHHWLLALVERHGAMAEAMGKDFDSGSVRRELENKLRQGNVGDPLDCDRVVDRALELAKERGRAQANERDLAAAILGAAGYELRREEAAARSVSSTAGGTTPDVAPATYAPRARRPTPTLEQFGRDLTQKALEGGLNPVVGRADETQMMIETLCRQSKRNPVLVGAAGVGKTAIVEGLAQRIVRGEVPEALRNTRVLEIQASSLVAGAHMAGELQERVKRILGEASQDGVILFIDEVHTLIGAGGNVGTSDVASQLKPALARGDMACVAATTDAEYRRFIESDTALERRFQPIRVQEMTQEETLQVLSVLRDAWQRARGLSVPDDVLAWLVSFAGQFLRNRNFPDKAVDLLDQSIGHAATHDRDRVDQQDAERVAQRMVGMPLSLDDRLAALRQRLASAAVLDEPDTETLVNRLTLSLRGMDIRPLRPNAVVLLLGDLADRSDVLARTIAEALFGSADRVVAIDFSPFVEHWSVTSLIGAGPGYVGYSDSVPLHKVAQMPWCVLRCENVDDCHPTVRDVLTQGLAQGFITDGRGRHIYLSDCVVLLTSRSRPASRGRSAGLGFAPREPPAAAASDPEDLAADAVGLDLARQVDAVFYRPAASGGSLRRWLEDGLLADMAGRFRNQGMVLTWDETFLDWLLEQHGVHALTRDWERLMDERVGPKLIAHLPSSGGKEVKHLTIRYEAGAIQVVHSSLDTGANP